MYLTKKTKREIDASIIVRNNTEARLRTKCFRGTTIKRAGNFFRWDSAESLFSDQEVLEQFLEELDDAWQDQDFGTHSVTITHPLFVGWEGTDELIYYSLDDLERFDLNRKSWGLRVKQERGHLLSPKTQELTIVFEFKREKERAVAVIHSLYPGCDVGELIGDVTEREQRVFFDWNHHGRS